MMMSSTKVMDECIHTHFLNCREKILVHKKVCGRFSKQVNKQFNRNNKILQNLASFVA